MDEPDENDQSEECCKACNQSQNSTLLTTPLQGLSLANKRENGANRARKGSLPPTSDLDWTNCCSLCGHKMDAGQSLQAPDRPIYPSLPYSPFSSPNTSPRFRRFPARECRRVSIETHVNYTQLNQYRLKESIGQGSFGIVKLAYNEEDNNLYAMKIVCKKKLMKRLGIFGRIPPYQKDGKRSSICDPLEPIYREIAVLKKLDHPHIVRLIEVLDDPDDDKLYMVFELLEKGAVIDIPTDTPLSEDMAWQYIREVVIGIEYLHFQKIIHCDIKPSNILLGEDGHIQLADFGVCSQFDGCDAYLFGTVGTPAFIAPEALQETKNGYSGKALDVWSMGVTLFCFLYGKLPFYDDNIMGLYQKIKTKEVVFPKLENPVDEQVEDLILAMLHKNPLERITVAEIKVHPWITKNGAFPLPSESDNCRVPVEVTQDDIEHSVRSIPKLDTLILVKSMLKKHSFCHPFKSGNNNKNHHKGSLWKTGRSNSAPSSYELVQERKMSQESTLPVVNEFNPSTSGDDVNEHVS